jgi:hypothetical protein
MFGGCERQTYKFMAVMFFQRHTNGLLGVLPLVLPSLLRSCFLYLLIPGVALRFTPGWRRYGPTGLTNYALMFLLFVA